LLPAASHVKLDMTISDEDMLRETIHRVRKSSNAHIVACRINSERLLSLAKTLGCDLFHGDILDGSQRQRPHLLTGSASLRLLTCYPQTRIHRPPASPEVMLGQTCPACALDPALDHGIGVMHHRSGGQPAGLRICSTS
jgi:hypothetical protein